MSKSGYSMKASLGFLARLSAVLVLLGCAQSLYAQTFDFSYTGSGITASGDINTTFVSAGEYLITSLSGTQNGNPMTLLPPGSYGSNDNLVFFPAPFLDLAGASFSIMLGSVDYNVYYDAGLAEYLLCNSGVDAVCFAGDGVVVDFTLTPEPIPEAGTMVLFGSGLLALAGILRRKLFA